jgi:hypothetical protein
LPALRTKRRLAALALVVAAITASSLPVRAQPESYKPHMDNGVKLFNDKNYPAAIAEFKAAYDARPNPNPLVNIALCQKALFDYPKAIAALESALAKHGDTMSPSDRKASEDAITEMRALLGVVIVTMTPPSAALTLDGENLPAGKAPRTLTLGPGAHKIEAHAPGFASGEARVVVTSGKTQEIKLDLAAETGLVTITAPDARMTIAVDQRVVGTGKWSGPLPPGTHVVQMSGPGAPPYDAQILVVAGKPLDVRVGVGGVPIRRKPELEMRRGLYVLGTGSLLFSLTHPPAWQSPTTDFGAAYGVRVGFQVNNTAGFDLSYQHSSVSTGIISKSDESGETSYRILADRVGASLRLISPGKMWRFVGTLGGGVVIDGVKFGPSAEDACNPPANTTCPFKNDNTGGGVDAFGLVEAGVELDVDRVLIDLGLEVQFQSTGNLTTEVGSKVVGIYGARPIINLGPALRVGYRFW